MIATVSVLRCKNKYFLLKHLLTFRKDRGRNMKASILTNCTLQERAKRMYKI
jgi:hypothetical protein